MVSCCKVKLDLCTALSGTGEVCFLEEEDIKPQVHSPQFDQLRYFGRIIPCREQPSDVVGCNLQAWGKGVVCAAVVCPSGVVGVVMREVVGWRVYGVEEGAGVGTRIGVGSCGKLSMGRASRRGSAAWGASLRTRRGLLEVVTCCCVEAMPELCCRRGAMRPQ